VSRRDEVLGGEMVRRLGLSQGVVNEIEDHLDLVLARAREEMDDLHSRELQGVKHEVHAKVGDTMEAMHVHWEARDSRNTVFWGKEISTLNRELDRVGQDYLAQRAAHQSLAEKGAKRAQETSVMRKELEACRQELKTIKGEKVVQEWLMYEYPGGDDECDLSLVPNELKEAVRGIWERKPRRRTTGRAGDRKGKNLFPDPRVPVGETNGAPAPPRYTEAVEVGRVRDPSSAMSMAPSSAGNTAERAGSMEGTSSVVDHYSSKTSEEVNRDGDAVTLDEGTTSLTMATTLESLGTAMLRMQERQETSWQALQEREETSRLAMQEREETSRLLIQERQEALIREIRVDFASKMTANTQATQREMEELRAATGERQRRVREEMDMARAVNYIDSCTKKRAAGGDVMSDLAQERQRGHYGPAGGSAEVRVAGSGAPSQMRDNLQGGGCPSRDGAKWWC
jgi:hypothetical protein